MQIYLSLVVCILGLVVYVITSHAKASELGRLAFWVGLFVFLLQFGAGSVAIRR